ncbi:hypothetical protein [Chitinophaga rhizosphaerae]|uniref:hypothetical protein n=1 Tax=Chitinophaga rhizosphaerae TaxID=1864947 RepID=UPI000F80A446|nr:hypothetical protein [Chitinophaga rhizosphaerae]
MIEGYRTRDAQRQEPFRMLYWLTFNANSKKPKSFRAMQEEWPLYTDKLDNSIPDIEMMNQAWDRLQNVSNGSSRN